MTVARPITKAEQAARDCVAEFIANPWHSEYEKRAWQAVFAVAGSDGWWHKPTACVWFATVPMGGGCGPLLAVGLGATLTHAELRVRMGHDAPPAEASVERDGASLDRERLRLAAARVKYHEAVTPALRRHVSALVRVLGELDTEVGQLELPNLDLDAVK